jgi:Zn-dependent peptidase ImmA (M78 family)
MENAKIVVPHLKNIEIWKYADELLDTYWNKTIPVDIEYIAENNLNLSLTPFPGLTKAIPTRANSILLKNNEIIYDSSLNDFRIRFSIAHEVGHFIMHKEIFDASPSTYDEWDNFIHNISNKEWTLIELQAYEFAGRVLVPRNYLIDIVSEQKDNIIKIRDSGFKDKDRLNEYLANFLSKKFEVSAEVIIKRLKKEKINPFELV